MSARAPHHQLRPDPLVTAANRLVPVPAEVIHPHVGAHALLTASPVRRASSAADLAPSALRPGAGCTESAAGGQWVAVDENGVRFNT